MATSTTTADQLNSGAMLAVTRNMRGDARVSTVTDLAYDSFGKRLASVSSDATIRIRDLDDRGEWKVEDRCEIRGAHKGLIVKVCWAHPVFGQVLATCSHDKTVKIWQEHVKSQSEAETRTDPRWQCVATIEAGSTAVYDVKFAPSHLGATIATGSGDGRVRIFGTGDAFSMASWSTQAIFEPDGGQRQSGVLCLAWCKSRWDCPMLIVGTSTGKVQIWRTDLTRNWRNIIDLPGHESRPVTGVDWACDMGRPFYNVASCGADGKLRVHRLSKQRRDWATGVVEVRPLRSFELQNGPKYATESIALGVEFDRTGTILKSSSDDCVVRLWQRDFEGNWTRVDGFGERVGVGGGTGGGAGEDGNTAGTAT